jgi:predicted O-methyltransferase YrrM
MLNDSEYLSPPAALPAIERESEALQFPMGSEAKTGSLLRTLAATKPGGAFLELGTGTGIGTAWILAGMDQHARLTSIDNDATVMAVARRHLGYDPRVTFHTVDGAQFLATLRGQQFDFIFADTWPGKYDHLDEALSLLKPGGLYIIDDLLPQPSWPDGHAAKVTALIADLHRRADLLLTKLSWSSGVIVATKRV